MASRAISLSESTNSNETNLLALPVWHIGDILLPTYKPIQGHYQYSLFILFQYAQVGKVWHQSPSATQQISGQLGPETSFNWTVGNPFFSSLDFSETPNGPVYYLQMLLSGRDTADEAVDLYSDLFRIRSNYNRTQPTASPTPGGSGSGSRAPGSPNFQSEAQAQNAKGRQEASERIIGMSVGFSVLALVILVVGMIWQKLRKDKKKLQEAEMARTGQSGARDVDVGAEKLRAGRDGLEQDGEITR